MPLFSTSKVEVYSMAKYREELPICNRLPVFEKFYE